ncbi:MAG: carbohydrate ABC transporter substrate-binding protein [Provencibacterium sp.]|nr:carbohydrate ABC transporter substrate-binding protein [Provencibacterium sp.]
MKKRIGSGFLAFALLSGVLAGCQAAEKAPEPSGSAASSLAESSSAVSSVQPGKDPDPVTLRFAWWGGEDRHKRTLEAIEAYQKLYPYVTLEGEYQGFDGYEQKLATQMAGGTVADILQISANRMKEFSQKNDIFADLSQYADVLDTSSFDANFLENFGVVEGKLYGLPTGINSINMAFVKHIQEEVGYGLEEGYTWEQFLEEGKKVHASDPNKYFFTGDADGYHQLLRSYVRQKTGEWTFRDDYTLSFDEAILTEFYIYLRRMLEEGVMEPMETAYPYKGKSHENKKWLGGEIACLIQNASSMPQFASEKVGEMTPGLFPILPDAKSTGIVTQPSQLFSVNDNENAGESARFLNYLFNEDEAITILGDCRGVPATEKGRGQLAAADLLDPTISKAVEVALAKTDGPINPLSDNNELKAILMDNIDLVLFAKMTPEEAAAQTIQQLTIKLEEIKTSAN